MAKIVIYGGTGYLGYHLTAKLAKEGHQITCLSRQLNCQADIREYANVKVQSYPKTEVEEASILEKTDYIINLVGTFDANKKRSQSAHVAHVEKIATLAKAHHIKKVIHVSTLGVSENVDSQYYKTKYDGEKALENALQNSTVQYAIVRPAFIFGKRAPLLDQLIRMASVFPYLMIPSSDAKLQPVYIMDTVDGMIALLKKNDLDRGIYEFAGSEEMSFIELVRKSISAAGISPKRMGKMPQFLAWLFAKTTGWIPKAPFTMNHYQSMKVSGVTDKNDLPMLGIALQSFESVMRFEYSDGVKDRYEKDREVARREPIPN